MTDGVEVLMHEGEHVWPITLIQALSDPPKE